MKAFMSGRLVCFVFITSLAVACPPAAHSTPTLPPILQRVGFDQRLDEQVPLDLAFVDEAGHSVKLANYVHDKPVILVLAYYRCPMLCTLVLNGLTQGMLDIPFTVGKEFEIVTVSIDPRETPAQAAAKKKTYVDRYGRLGAAEGWHFLTGGQESVDRLTAAVGFRYAYDAQRDEFAHASGIMMLTPSGKLSRYFYDVKFSGRDLKLGLIDASEHKIGSPVDQILLFCFHYDPNAGKYGPAVMTFVRCGGVLTLVVLGGFLFSLWRGDRRRQASRKEASDRSIVPAGSISHA
jgi:protein SCO1/2